MATQYHQKERINKADSRRKKEVVPVSVSPLSKTGQMLNLILRTPDQASHPNNCMLSTYLRHTRYVFQDLVSHGVIISIFITCPRIPASASCLSLPHLVRTGMRGTPRFFASVPLVSGAVAARLQTACELVVVVVDCTALVVALLSASGRVGGRWFHMSKIV